MTDPYLKVISEFNKNNIKYIVIGVSGINYYAKNAREIIMTGDYDIFLKPDTDNVLRAIKIMEKLEYVITAANKKIKSNDVKEIEKIVRKRKTLSCENYYHNLVDFCLDVSGYTFDDLEKNVRIFKAGKEKIKVAALKYLLRMKEIANRPKDRLFLQKYEEIL